jgi:hypothetical protein
MMHQLPKRKPNAKLNPLVDYQGIDFKLAQSSVLELLRDDCEATGFAQLTQSEPWTLVQKAILEFIRGTTSNISRVTTSQQAADLADSMKSDDKAVRSMVEAIFSEIALEDIGELNNIVYTPNLCVGYSICSACPYYLKSRICLIANRTYPDGDEQHIMFDSILKLSSSKKIAKALINIFHLIVVTEGNDLSTLLKYKCILEDIQSIMGLYKCMNPTGEEVTRQEDKLLDILRKPRIPMSEEENTYLYGILQTVFQDIESSNLQYVSDMRKCISAIRAEQSRGYTQDDYYLSMKATPQIVEGEAKRKSLLNSVLERDSFKYESATQDFDNFTGYQSYYLEDGPTIDRPIQTILIQNPGKFKMRGIHFAENAIQDRCNYIHRCIKRGLKELKSDCSQKQQEGREFAQLCTLNWALSEKDKRPGIYCLDFSNATDTMDQDLQVEILTKVMGYQVGNYWKMLSQKPKVFVRQDGTVVPYNQIAGQPQGLLGSFDAFSLAHHFMMLMVMKMGGLTRHYSNEFYRVLGDDSIIFTIEPEEKLLENGISILELYKMVCRWANFEVNDDKGVYTYAGSDKALASFAKVDFMNGVHFSPTPYRLATAYNGYSLNKTENGHISVAIWRVVTGYPGHQEFLTQSLSHFSNGKWIQKVLQNGYFQSVSKNFLNLNDLSDSQRARINYCLACSIIESSMNSIFMSDKELATRNPKRPRNSFEELFRLLPEEELERIPMEHKIFMVLDKNEKSDRFLSDLLQLDTLDEKCLRICCELIERSFDKDIDDCYLDLVKLASTHEIINKAVNNPFVDVSLVFPEASKSLTSALEEMKMGLMTRGLTKKPTRVSYILKETFDLYKRVELALGKLPEDSNLITD